ncbi:hypothetical protein BDY24DRAFT_32912 [Mrakia frigida]|uniref:uncharacterized protein n=1 Tax=Mrakia frigida TaxID=29902 RepID=UPI003FCC0003
MDMDTEDIFESSLSSLFSQPIIAHSLPASETHLLYTHPSLPSPFKLLLASPPANLNHLQASYLWPSSLYLAHLLLSETIPLRKDGTERIAELGAGSGLAGVAASWKMRAEGGELVSTDFGAEEILKALKENLETNIGPSSSSSGVNWEVLGHEWGASPSALLLSPSSSTSPRRFPTLLLSDLLHYTAGHSDLLSSILALLLPSEEGGTAHLTAGLHGGRGAVERFVELARGRGCVVEEIEVVIWDSGKEEWVRVSSKEEEDGEGRVWRGTLRVGKGELFGSTDL